MAANIHVKWFQHKHEVLQTAVYTATRN